MKGMARQMPLPTEIIRGPLVTEKSLRLREEHNQYLFRVDRRANKHQIKASIEALFGVEVEDVRTVNVLGKRRRRGLSEGRRPTWKKAVVTLPEGQSIELVEGA